MCLHCRTRTTDRPRRSPQSEFIRARKAEAGYAARLRKVARHVVDIVSAFDLEDARAASMIRTALERYAHAIDPWAEATATLMVAEVAQRDEAAWKAASERIGRGITAEIRSTPIGDEMRRLVNEQVALIKSLPLQAAERVQELAIRSIETGGRAANLAADIMRTGEVTKARANLIARTEIGRAASTFTQVRAEAVGSTGYLWRTARDTDVRPSHRKMEGHFVAWDAPPTLDGLTGHAGAIPNCRCYCEPIIPDI